MEHRLEDRERLVQTLANRHGRDLLDLRDLLHRQSAPEMRGDGKAEIFRQLQHRGTKPLSLFAFGEHALPTLQNIQLVDQLAEENTNAFMQSRTLCPVS